jgi:hypothetical protein
MNYIGSQHRETAQYMQCLSWSGGLVSNMFGTVTYEYVSNGWTVTMTYPIVNNPVYTVTVMYEKHTACSIPDKVIVNWQGEWQNAAIRQTYYSYDP